jgi:hypothetical protein
MATSRLVKMRPAHPFSLASVAKAIRSATSPIFDAEFAQDAFDVLADRSGASAEDRADLIVRFTLCDPSQNLSFTRSKTQGTKRASVGSGSAGSAQRTPNRFVDVDIIFHWLLLDLVLENQRPTP